MADLDSVREPEWLADAPRARRRAGRDARPAAVQGHAGLGVHLDSRSSRSTRFAAAAPGDGDASAVDRVQTLLEAPEGAVTLGQVDGRVIETPGRRARTASSGEGARRPAARRSPSSATPSSSSRTSARSSPATDVFTAANDADWTGGAFVYVPRGVRVDTPILLTAIADAAGTALNRRTLIVLEEGAEAEVWEQFLSAREDGESMLNTVVELVVGQNARLRYVCGQDMNEKSWIFGTQRAEVARDGTSTGPRSRFGSARGKVRMETLLAGEGSHAKVTGAYAPHAPPAPRLRHHAGARRGRTPRRTSPSAASSPTARRRSGAG